MTSATTTTSDGAARPAPAGETDLTEVTEVTGLAELTELIGQLRVRDVRLGADGDALHYDAPPGAVTDELLARLRDHKPALLRWLARHRDEPVVEASGPALYTQRRMRAFCAQSRTPGGYNVAQRIPLNGPLDPAALGRALTALTRRQAVLRTRLTPYGSELVQEVLPVTPVPLPVTDLRELPAAERGPAAEEWVRQQAGEPFALSVASFLRTALLRTDEERWTLVLVVHHIMIDGWGLGVLLNDLAALYVAASRRPGPELPTDAEAGLPPLPLTYTEAGRWQRAHLSGPRRDRLRDFWSEALADAPMRVNLPYDRPRPEAPSGRGAEVSVRIPPELSADVRALARAQGTTAFTVLLSVFGALLGRLTGQHEIVVACNIANRVRREHESLVGGFTNNIALRLRPGSAGTFAGLVADTGRMFFAAVDHQEYPLAMVLEDLAARLPAGPRFPQVIVAMQTQEPPVLDLPGLTSEVHDIPVDGAKGELCLILIPEGESIACVINYATDLLDAATVERWSAEYVALLREAVRDPELPPGTGTVTGTGPGPSVPA